MKACSQCQKSQPLTEYWSNRRSVDKKQYACKTCLSTKGKIRADKNRPELREYSKNYEKTRRARPADWRVKRNHYRARTVYGLSRPELLTMLMKQDNSCKICTRNIVDKYTIDHCHNTGKVRGLLCRHCNLLLGNAQDSTAVLMNAVEYLEGL